MKMMMLLSLTISSFYLLSSHPVALTGLILMQAFMICGIGWAALKVSWFSYILFLIFLGGLMVLFIYITSLASNEAFKPAPLNLTALVPLMSLAGWALSSGSESLSKLMSLDLDYLTTLYSNYLMTLTIGAMLYLLLTLVVVVKITSKFNAPVKNFIFY